MELVKIVALQTYSKHGPPMDLTAGEQVFTHTDIRDILRETLEELWDTEWGQAEVEACERIVALALDPESTQRIAVTPH
jgi:hypothetical protein